MAKTGVFANHIESHKEATDANGNYATFGAGPDAGSDFYVSSEEDETAILSEADFGLAYCLNHKWRLITGYRVFAISGYADAVDQIPDNFDSYGNASRINNQGSLILHGGYIGGEFIW